MKSLISLLNESLQQQVFVVLKPGSLDLAQVVIERFEQSGWKVARTTTKQLLLEEAKKLYEVHKKEDFYKSLCEYMASGPCRAFIFTKRGTQSSKSFKEVAEIKEEIREKYGESDMRNVLHSSDNSNAMEKEARIFFVL